MAPTQIDVEPAKYYTAGNRCYQVAGAIFDAFDANIKLLAECGAMAGTDETGREWASAYDQNVSDLMFAMYDVVPALENYGSVLIQAGYNHALADHNATLGGGSPPSAPTLLTSHAMCLSAAPSSAGGPGGGLVDDVLNLASEVGIPVPDGDTSKLERAGNTWNRLATGYTATIALPLKGIAEDFEDISSPEVVYIVDDLYELQDSVEQILTTCADLARICRDYKQALDELRSQLRDILEDLATELAISAAIAIASAFVTFGAGAAAGVANAGRLVVKYGRIIRSLVDAWRIAKQIGRGTKTTKDLNRLRAILQRFKDLKQQVNRTVDIAKALEKLPPGSKIPTTKEIQDAVLSLDRGSFAKYLQSIWGRGGGEAAATAARDRIGTYSAEELGSLGLNLPLATQLRNYYTIERELGRGMPAIEPRLELLNDIVRTLGGT